MNKNHSNRDKDEFEYEEFAGLDLPLELTDEEREICKKLVDSAKPISQNYWLWKIERWIFIYQNKLRESFHSACEFVAKRQILSFILCFVCLMIIGFLLVFFLGL